VKYWKRCPGLHPLHRSITTACRIGHILYDALVAIIGSALLLSPVLHSPDKKGWACGLLQARHPPISAGPSLGRQDRLSQSTYRSAVRLISRFPGWTSHGRGLAPVIAAESDWLSTSARSDDLADLSPALPAWKAANYSPASANWISSTAHLELLDRCAQCKSRSRAEQLLDSGGT